MSSNYVHSSTEEKRVCLQYIEAVFEMSRFVLNPGDVITVVGASSEGRVFFKAKNGEVDLDGFLSVDVITLFSQTEVLS